MAFVEDTVEAITEGGLGVGAIIGIGALLAWPLVRPALREGTKLAIRGGMGLYAWGAQAVAEVREGMGDLVTEAADRQDSSSGTRRHSSGASTASEG